MPSEPPREDPLLALRLHQGREDEAARVQRALAGDAEARAWLVDRFSGLVYRFALRMMRDEQDARDAAQDALVKMLRRLDQYDPARPLQAWVLGIARNVCIDEFRRRKRLAWDEPAEQVDPSPTPLVEVSRAQRAEHLQAALQELPPLYREVLVLYHFEHLKYTEIAESLDIPLGTVMNRIFRARRKLRDLYQAQGGEP